MSNSGKVALNHMQIIRLKLNSLKRKRRNHDETRVGPDIVVANF